MCSLSLEKSGFISCHTGRRFHPLPPPPPPFLFLLLFLVPIASLSICPRVQGKVLGTLFFRQNLTNSIIFRHISPLFSLQKLKCEFSCFFKKYVGSFLFCPFFFLFFGVVTSNVSGGKREEGRRGGRRRGPLPSLVRETPAH